MPHQFIHLRRKRLQGPVVVDDDVGRGKARSVVHLLGNPRACVGLVEAPRIDEPPDLSLIHI